MVVYFSLKYLTNKECISKTSPYFSHPSSNDQICLNIVLTFEVIKIKNQVKSNQSYKSK